MYEMRIYMVTDNLYELGGKINTPMVSRSCMASSSCDCETLKLAASRDESSMLWASSRITIWFDNEISICHQTTMGRVSEWGQINYAPTWNSSGHFTNGLDSRSLDTDKN